jgi:hypothetical protein
MSGNNPPRAPVDVIGAPYVDLTSMGAAISSSNPLPTAGVSPDFLIAASAGLIPGASVAYVVGHVAGLAQASGPVDVCEQGEIYPFLSAASTMSIVSASANDTESGGTGAQVLEIEGLDLNYNPISETLNITGTTPVTSTNSYLRINEFGVIQAGTNMMNVGDITMTATSNSSIQGIIRAGIGDSQQAVYTVPAGFIGLLAAAQFSMAGQITTAFGQAALVSNSFGQTAYNVGTRIDMIAGFPYSAMVLIGFPNPAMTDITARVLSVGQDNTQVSAGFTLILLDQSVFPASIR